MNEELNLRRAIDARLSALCLTPSMQAGILRRAHAQASPRMHRKLSVSLAFALLALLLAASAYAAVRFGVLAFHEDQAQNDTYVRHIQEIDERVKSPYAVMTVSDAVFDGVGVYASRIRAGRFLAQDSPVEADLVVGVPESGNPAAQGYAIESKIPYGIAFIKNSYVSKKTRKRRCTCFSSMRESSVQVKLNVLKDNVRGKRIIMIDDSIVRGTTCGRIVQMLKDAGAKEVHVRISSPPFLHPCYFGTDIPTEDQLIAHGRTVEEIRQIIGADSLAYLRMERLPEICEGLPFCDACFSGNYPLDPPDHDIRGEQG